MAPHEGRLHALDNLRALMMWLGIVIHASANYIQRDTPFPWRDEHRTRLADFAIIFIHTFRMPVFFILAGFFVMLLLQSRGPGAMAKHRAARLGLPFAVFWPPILVLSTAAAIVFIHLTMRGTWGFDPGVIDELPQRADMPPIPRGPNTMHMWFLWMLLWFSLATALLARWVPAAFWQRPAAVVRRIAAAWWAPLPMALVLVATDIGYPRGFMFPSGSFIPPLAEWLHHAIFFIVGLAIYGVREELFAVYQRRWKVFAVAGFVAFAAAGRAYDARATLLFASAYSLCTCLWSFAVLGASLKWLSPRTPWLAYLSESSYWVYLVHFPLTIAFGVALYAPDLPGAVKMLLNIAATTAVCLATYHWFVRFTWVGVLLNGKRHPRRIIDVDDAAARVPTP
jgi:glucans biosynthesis protein C